MSVFTYSDLVFTNIYSPGRRQIGKRGGRLRRPRRRAFVGSTRRKHAFAHTTIHGGRHNVGVCVVQSDNDSLGGWPIPGDVGGTASPGPVHIQRFPRAVAGWSIGR